MDMKSIFDTISHKSHKFIPRIKQEEISQKIVDYLKGHDVCGLSAICRFGKTATVMYAIKKYYENDSWRGKTVAFISYYPSNFEQQIDDFKMVFGNGNVNVSNRNAKEFSYSRDKINIIMLSSQFSSREELNHDAKKHISKADFVIYDEAHIAFGSERQQNFLSYAPENGKTIVVSATPYNSKLVNMQFFSFTDYEKFMCDVNGIKDYYSNPSVIHVGISEIMDKKTKKTYSWNSCDELLHSGNEDNRALYSVLNSIIEKGYYGFPLNDYIKEIHKRFKNYSLYSEEPKKRYLNNFIIWCNACKDIPVIIDTLNSLKDDWEDKCCINVKFSVSDMNSNEYLSEYYQYYEKDSLLSINSMFNSKPYGKKRVLNFYICVDMNSTGCTIRNADADIHLHDGKSFNDYEQKVGRIKERTLVKNVSGLEEQYSHFTVSFDALRGRMLTMVESIVPHTESGNVDRDDDEFKYINVLYGYMNFCGIIEIPSADNFICDMISNSQKNLSEKLTNRELIYRCFSPTGNLDIANFDMSSFYNEKNSSRGNLSSNESISIENDHGVHDGFGERRQHETDERKEHLKSIAFTYSELLKKAVFFMHEETMKKVDSGELSFFQAVDETFDKMKVNRICYE